MNRRSGRCSLGNRKIGSSGRFFFVLDILQNRAKMSADVPQKHLSSLGLFVVRQSQGDKDSLGLVTER